MGGHWKSAEEGHSWGCRWGGLGKPFQEDSTSWVRKDSGASILREVRCGHYSRVTVWTNGRAWWPPWLCERNRRWTYFHCWSLERLLSPACPGLSGKESTFSLLPGHMCARSLVQTQLSGREIRQESEGLCSQHYGKFILYSFLFSKAKFKLLQRLGVSYMLQTHWQSRDTGSQNCEQAPQLFWGLAVLQPFTLRGPGGWMCRPGIVHIDRNRLSGMEKQGTQRGDTYPAIWVCTPRCIFASKVDIGYFWLFSTKMNLNKTTCKQIHFSKSLSFIILQLDCNLLVSRIRLKQSVGNDPY